MRKGALSMTPILGSRTIPQSHVRRLVSVESARIVEGLKSELED